MGGMVADAGQILTGVDVVLVVDWPSRDVPDTLVRGGFTVVVHGGPGPEDFSAYELEGDGVVIRPPGPPPEHADLVYTHRPIEELPDLVIMAGRIGARTIWLHSGVDPSGSRDPRGCWMPEEDSRRAREIVESAGLGYLDEPYIADAVRALGAGM